MPSTKCRPLVQQFITRTYMEKTPSGFVYAEAYNSGDRRMQRTIILAAYLAICRYPSTWMLELLHSLWMRA